MKGFTKFIIENHPDPDALVGGINGKSHNQMCMLAENYAKHLVIEELRSVSKTEEIYNIRFNISKRIKELKQD